MSEHAKFSPSKMQRIIQCPGSIALESRYTDRGSNKSADEGTAAHDLAAQALIKGTSVSLIATPWAVVDEEGKVTWTQFAPPEGTKGTVVFADEEFVEYVQVYVDTVRRMAHGKTLLVEQRVEFSNTIGVNDQFGTSDAIIVDVPEATLYVGDLKFGANPKGIVFAERNEQMMSYAVGVLETFVDVLPKIKRVVLFISQPRLDHYDEWECTMEDLQKHAKLMRAAAEVALKGLALYEADQPLDDAFFKAGNKQCHFCKAKNECPTLAATVGEAVWEDFQALAPPKLEHLAVSDPPRVPGSVLLGQRYAVLDLVEDWCSAVRAECERQVAAGIVIEGPDGLPMKIVEGRKGHRAWKDAKMAEGMLAGILPPEKFYQPQEIITPSVADKLLNKKKTAAQWEPFKDLIRQLPGKPSVVLGSDPRAPYSGAASFEDFADEDLSI